MSEQKDNTVCRREVYRPGGKVEQIEVKEHTFAWSGWMPCTGAMRCIYCGVYEDDISLPRIKNITVLPLGTKACDRCSEYNFPRGSSLSLEKIEGKCDLCEIIKVKRFDIDILQKALNRMKKAEIQRIYLDFEDGAYISISCSGIIQICK